MKILKKILLLSVVCLTFLAAATTIEESLEDIRRQAELGDVAAQFTLGSAYYKGRGVKEDKNEAIRWYRKAAEQGGAAAQFILGTFYTRGYGVEKNENEAVRWYRKAAKQGYAAAQSKLGADYYFGINGVKEDKAEGERLWRRAAGQGHADAQYYLGGWFGHDEKGWYRKAAEQGHTGAQNSIGNAYYYGIGVKKSKRFAMRWYRKAAKLGNALAQFILGSAYYEGEGVKEDKFEAARWYHKAAEQGYVKAQYKLSEIYWKGEGVVKNQHEAYVWHLAAKTKGRHRGESSTHLTTPSPFSYRSFQIQWSRFLTKAEVKSARRDAARRVVEIEKKRKKYIQVFYNSLSTDVEFAVAKSFSEINVAAKVFENTWQSIVMIEDDEGQGSGVIIRQSLVATSCHVIDGGNVAVYKPKNKRIDTSAPFYTTVHHRDDARGFCILKVKGLQGNRIKIRKYKTLRIGEKVYAVGALQNLDLSISEGLISQLPERGAGDNRRIQANVTVSPDFSGGGLFDAESNLIGIVTRKFADEATEGIIFAIPADLALEI